MANEKKWRNPKTGKLETEAEIHARIELHRRADEAWDKGWDDARDEDVRLGRRYDHRIYAERAHAASAAVLGVCRYAVCSCVTKRSGFTTGKAA